MLECAIHPITYRGEGILATVVKSSVSANFTKVANLLTILKNNVILNFVRGREPQKGSQGGHALPMVNQAIHST